MKIALILPGNIWFAPYVKIYENILNELNVKYDIISWNRDGQDEPRVFQFDKPLSNLKPRHIKLLSFIKYAKFVINCVKIGNYDKLVIFGPQLSILLSFFLIKYYSKKYIIDYRDLSIEQNFYLKPLFKCSIKRSYAIFVSSPGFIKYLPKNFQYLISHNFDINLVKSSIANKTIIPFKTNEYHILTIGSIRDYDSNSEVIRNLLNKHNYKISFVGKGEASIPLYEFSNSLFAKNVFFKNYYKKEEEGNFYSESSMINIYYPNIITHSTALSNRFYNGLIYKKPMIVTSNSIQGNYVKSYNIGITLDNCNDLAKKIENYFQNTDVYEFNKNCNELLSNFIADYKIFVKTIKKFCQNN